MKWIKSFKLFESQIELLNETKFYFLSNFRRALRSAPSEFDSICGELFDLYGEEIGDDITFIDIDDKNLSYTTKRNIEKEYPQLIYRGDLTWIPSDQMYDMSNYLLDSPTRGKIKIGRFLNKVINTPKKYPESLIDKFVVYLQSKSVVNDNYTYKLVKGDEVAKYYNSINYSSLKGTLGKSCMNDKESGIFDIYTKNPEVCSLLVMLDSSEKLVARALVWDVDIKGNKIKFLDRVYWTEDWMVYNMRKWAENNDMAFKLTNYNIQYKGDKIEDRMEVKIKKIHYSKFPYLDTFIFYDVKEGKLLNYKGKNGFELQSTGGDYFSTTGYSPIIRNYIRRFNR